MPVAHMAYQSAAALAAYCISELQHAFFLKVTLEYMTYLDLLIFGDYRSIWR